METQENYENKKSYPFKSFAVFIVLYLLSVATYYPVLLEQATVYLEILGGTDAFTPSQFAGLALAQPILLGIVAIYFGHRYLEKVQLRSLIYEEVENSRNLDFNREKFTLKESVPFVVVIALGLAILNLSVDFVFQQWLPVINIPTAENTTIWQVLSNVLYSGFGQEILLRLGIMTTLIYILSSRGQSLTKNTYLFGFIFTAILYALSQQNSIAPTGNFTVLLWIRHLLVNGLDGILYGWLFYKFHFEAAFISHMLTNALIIGGSLVLGGLLT